MQIDRPTLVHRSSLLSANPHDALGADTEPLAAVNSFYERKDSK